MKDIAGCLGKLRALGYRIAIDDLGAGYASLNAVALLEPDFLKIDMTIVRGIDESLSRSRLVRRIVEFANDQGIRVIAEGVETKEECEVVEEWRLCVCHRCLLHRSRRRRRRRRVI